MLSIMDLKDVEWFFTIMIVVTVSLPALFIFLAFHSHKSVSVKTDKNEYGLLITEPEQRYNISRHSCDAFPGISWIWGAFAIGSLWISVMLGILMLSS